MKIGIANDHRGVEIKNKIINFLEEKGYVVIDYGTNTEESVDYPEYAFKISKAVINKEIDLGILFCGTGIGMSIAANKVKGIRCAKIDNDDDAFFAKCHNQANVIAFGMNSNSLERIKEMITIFLNAKIDSDSRHQRRIELIDTYENI